MRLGRLGSGWRRQRERFNRKERKERKEGMNPDPTSGLSGRLTLAQAAEQLGMSVRTLQRKVKDKKIGCLKGEGKYGRVKFTQRDLDQLRMEKRLPREAPNILLTNVVVDEVEQRAIRRFLEPHVRAILSVELARLGLAAGVKV